MPTHHPSFCCAFHVPSASSSAACPLVTVSPPLVKWMLSPSVMRFSPPSAADSQDLREMIDQLQSLPITDTPAVKQHVRTLQLLLNPPAHPPPALQSSASVIPAAVQQSPLFQLNDEGIAFDVHESVEETLFNVHGVMGVFINTDGGLDSASAKVRVIVSAEQELLVTAAIQQTFPHDFHQFDVEVNRADPGDFHEQAVSQRPICFRQEGKEMETVAAGAALAEELLRSALGNVHSSHYSVLENLALERLESIADDQELKQAIQMVVNSQVTDLGTILMRTDDPSLAKCVWTHFQEDIVGPRATRASIQAWIKEWTAQTLSEDLEREHPWKYAMIVGEATKPDAANESSGAR
jgi:hypothetical protein